MVALDRVATCTALVNDGRSGELLLHPEWAVGLGMGPDSMLRARRVTCAPRPAVGLAQPVWGSHVWR